MRSKQKQTRNATNATVPFIPRLMGGGKLNPCLEREASFRICSASRRWANLAPKNGFLEKAQADTRYATSMQSPRLAAQSRGLVFHVTTMAPSLWHFIFLLRPYQCKHIFQTSPRHYEVSDPVENVNRGLS